MEASGHCVSQCVGLLETLVFVYKRVVFPFAFSTCWFELTIFRGVIIRETVETKTLFLYFINSLGNCHCQKLRTFPDIVFFFVNGTFVYLLWAVLLRRALICIWFESSLIWCFVFVSVVDYSYEETFYWMSQNLLWIRSLVEVHWLWIVFPSTAVTQISQGCWGCCPRQTRSI